jgi:hypothetical protein
MLVSRLQARAGGIVAAAAPIAFKTARRGLAAMLWNDPLLIESTLLTED